MTDKIKVYLDGMFATVPATGDVLAAKEELYAGMTERYQDYLAEGLDEQAAYDAVIDSIGDIRELFDELNHSNQSFTQNTSQGYTKEPAGDSQSGLNFNALFQSISSFTEAVVSGVSEIFASTPEDLPLVNSQTLSLEEISMLDISYITEPIKFGFAEGESLVINEYMNRDEAPLYAEITSDNGQITVRNGRRQNILWLRSKIEVLIPSSWNGSLTISTISGGITSDDAWNLSSITAKTISGHIKINSLTASMIRLSATSGTVELQYGKGCVDMHCISGSVKAEMINGGGTFKTTAGSVRVNFEEMTSHVEATTVSGGIRLGIPEEANFELDAKSTSGSIHTAFDEKLTFQKRSRAHGFIGVAPFMHVRVHSTSGSIHIND